MSEWPLVPIRSIASPGRWSLNGGPFGSKLVSKMYVDAGVPVIRGANLPLGQRFSDEGFVFVSEAKADELKAHTAQPGDVIITQRGTLGQVGIIPDEAKYRRYVISQSQMKLTVAPNKADPHFIYYAFRTPSIAASFVALASTSGVPHVNLQTLRDFEVPLPPIETQRRIAGILGAYDDLIEVNRRRVMVLEEMARGLFEEWFVRLRFPGHEAVPFLDTPDGQRPQGWRRAPIGDAFDGLYDGPHATPPPSDEGPVFLGIGNITETGQLDLASVRHIAEGDFGKWTKRVTPEAGDIVFTYEATLNRYAVIPEGFRGCLGRRLALIRARSKAGMNHFLFLHFFSDDWRTVIAMNTLSGATVDRVPLKRFPEFPITLPPDDLVAKFGEMVAPMFAMKERLAKANQRLTASRDLLLPRLMSGQLSVAEAAKELELA